MWKAEYIHMELARWQKPGDLSLIPVTDVNMKEEN